MPIGSVFGRWRTLSAPAQLPGERNAHVDAVCALDLGGDGTLGRVRTNSLRQGVSRSCGCFKRDQLRAMHADIANWTQHPAYKGENGLWVQKLRWYWTEKSGPCVDCGDYKPRAMTEFDHREGRTAESFSICIAEVGSSRSLDELKRERDKCDLVCANCHRLRTANRKSISGHSKAFLEHELMWLEDMREQDPGRFELERTRYETIVDELESRKAGLDG